MADTHDTHDTHIQWRTDASHGWLQVPIEEVLNRPEVARSISEFSYRDNQFAYLEEDCDAPRFCKAIIDEGIMTASDFQKLNDKYDGDYSSIRKLPRWA